VSNNARLKGTTMFELTVFAGLMALLIVLAGPAYPQTWKQRWGN
jgi:Tfp pilus assembly protein FimT